MRPSLFSHHPVPDPDSCRWRPFHLGEKPANHQIMAFFFLVSTSWGFLLAILKAPQRNYGWCETLRLLGIYVCGPFSDQDESGPIARWPIRVLKCQKNEEIAVYLGERRLLLKRILKQKRKTFLRAQVIKKERRSFCNPCDWTLALRLTTSTKSVVFSCFSRY